MEDFEQIVNRNHNEKTAAPKNESRRECVTRIIVSILIIIAAFAAFVLNLMHIYLAAPVMLAAYTVACFSLGRGVHLFGPKR